MIEEKKKVALLFICLNHPYWPYLKDVIEDARKFFLPSHQIDFFTWTDMPEDTNYGAKVFPTEPIQWPLPTLMRYSLFLQAEEMLKEYDYIFYMDADMRIVNTVGNEILGKGLTAAQHPMYAFRPGLQFPIEPNPASSAYIKMPKFYYAGGLQGGTSESFIKAMKVMKKNINSDFSNNYMARWNDESHWNRYLYDYEGDLIVLTPSYVYPDSLIEQYYKPIWGKDYPPKIITLTKPFSTSKQGGEAAKQWAEDFQSFK